MEHSLEQVRAYYMSKKKCLWCRKNYVEEAHHNSCSQCVAERSGKVTTHVDVPLKGSERWYREKWFRKNQKTWEEDIRSRKSMDSMGTVVGRFNEKGDRIA